MKIFSWNVNGIRAVIKKGDFKRFLDTYDPDILCVQETKAFDHQVEIDFPQYEEYWCSAEKKGYSGTAIFTKHAPVNILQGFPEEIAHKYALADQYGDTAKEGRIIVRIKQNTETTEGFLLLGETRKTGFIGDTINYNFFNTEAENETNNDEDLFD
jgi:exodeoxyribonuclease III